MVNKMLTAGHNAKWRLLKWVLISGSFYSKISYQSIIFRLYLMDWHLKNIITRTEEKILKNKETRRKSIWSTKCWLLVTAQNGGWWKGHHQVTILLKKLQPKYYFWIVSQNWISEKYHIEKRRKNIEKQRNEKEKYLVNKNVDCRSKRKMEANEMSHH